MLLTSGNLRIDWLREQDFHLRPLADNKSEPKGDYAFNFWKLKNRLVE
jgi:hypothetical protein